MMRAINKLITFLQESYSELKRVTWPSKEMVLGGTAAVLLVSLVFVLYMWVIDLIVSQIISWILR